MKKLEIKTKEYINLLNDYTLWLQTLGFSESSVTSFPTYIRELLHELENNGKTTITQTTKQDINNFLFIWKKRKNKITKAGLSNSYINIGILSLKKFVEYLSLTKKHHLEINLKYEPKQYKERIILTKREITLLYDATYSAHKENTLALGQKHRAMLAIYYGCGLRKNEGINLNLDDILHKERRLFVKKAKGGKQRYVPITERNYKDIMEYLNYGRKWFLQRAIKRTNIEEEAFFVGIFSRRMRDFTYTLCLLSKRAGINKRITLHTLRHSIATHLLQQGMDIEAISKFLGHSTIDSTQIYLHLLDE